MGLLDELEQYRQPNGLYSNQPHPENDSSGNCIAITSLALWLANRLGEFREPKNIQRIIDFDKEIHACEVYAYSGLLNRSPTKIDDQQGWDDYVALLTTSGKNVTNLPICNRILNRSKKLLCSFNNVDPGVFTFKSCFARYPQFLAHLRFANNLAPNIFFKLLWAVGVFFASFAKSPTSIILNYMMIEAMNGSSLICTMASVFWSRKMRNQDMATVIGDWLSVSKDAAGVDLPNLEHPIVKYWRVNG